MRIIARGIRNYLPILMSLGLFVLDAPGDIAILTFDLAGDGPSRRYGKLMRVFVLRLCSVYQV